MATLLTDGGVPRPRVDRRGTATITLTRSGGTSGGVTVAYETSDGTAVAGTNYAATSGTLTFADGETGKSFTVTALDGKKELVGPAACRTATLLLH